MAQRIDVPGQGIVEFPDEMSEAQIIAAIQRNARPTQETPGIGKTLMIGAGRTADKVMQGLTQAYGKATGDQGVLGGLAEQEAEKDALYKPLQEQRPYATGIGQALPMMAIPVGAGGAVLPTLGRAAMAGAAPGALSYGSIADRLKAGAVGGIGGVLGAGLGMGISKLLRPASKAASISPEAAAAAERLGVQLTAGAKTQNPALINFENYLAKSPGSAGAMQSAQAANQTAMQKAAAGAMGQQASDLSEGTFAAAKNAIGAEFSRLQNVTKPVLGNDFMQVLANIEGSNVAKGSFASPAVAKLIDKGLDLAAKQNLTGKAYKEIRTELSNEAKKAFQAGDATVGQAFKSLRSALDDAAEQSLSKADQEAWRLAREQWQAYKLLTKSNVAEAGNLSAPRLAAAMRQGGGVDALRTGAAKGSLADIARLGEAVKGAQNPNSGQLMQQMLYGNPLTGVPMMAANKSAQATYMSKPMQKYLANGLLDVGENGQMLLNKSGGLLGVPMLGNYLGQ